MATPYTFEKTLKSTTFILISKLESNCLSFYLFVFPHSIFGNSPNFLIFPNTTATSSGKFTQAQRAASCTHRTLNCAYTSRIPVSWQNFHASSNLFWVIPSICFLLLCSSPTSNQNKVSNPWILPHARPSGSTDTSGNRTSLQPAQISAWGHGMCQ